MSAPSDRDRARRLEAVGLRYDPESAGDGAPVVVARGRGEIAARLIALAEEHGVAVRRDPDLLRLLATARVGDEVPEELYTAVAHVIAFVWRVNAGMEASAR